MAEKHEQIVKRAYALWQAEGQPDGRHEEHWYCAAREIEAADSTSSAVKRRRGRKSAKRENVCGRGAQNLSRSAGSADRSGLEPSHHLSGTEGSNPACSSGESRY